MIHHENNVLSHKKLDSIQHSKELEQMEGWGHATLENQASVKRADTHTHTHTHTRSLERSLVHTHSLHIKNRLEAKRPDGASGRAKNWMRRHNVTKEEEDGLKGDQPPCRQW
jgi:hypothetical protein